MNNTSPINNHVIINFFFFFKDKSNFSDSGNKEHYESITEISKSDNGEALVNSKYRSFNLDNIVDNFYSKNKPLSVDGFLVGEKKNKIILYFVEFKGLDIDSENPKKLFKEVVEKLSDGCCNSCFNECIVNDKIINNLIFSKKRYEDEITNKIKYKYFESIFIVLPRIYEKFCEKKKYNYNLSYGEFISYLINKITKHYFIIFSNSNTKSITTQNQYKNSYLKNKINGNISHILNSTNTQVHIYDENTFINKLEELTLIKI